MRVSFRNRQAEIQKRMAKQRKRVSKTAASFQNIDPAMIEDAVVVEPIAIEDKTENAE